MVPEPKSSPFGMMLVALDLAVELVGALVGVTLPVVVAVVTAWLLVGCCVAAGDICKATVQFNLRPYISGRDAVFHGK